ncbi:hypothetical protein P4494_03680, partial [Ureibacillus terrenus]|nr:hypothetical protein [Ureibacillus terrenus]
VAFLLMFGVFGPLFILPKGKQHGSFSISLFTQLYGLNSNLRFTRFSVRGKSKVENEMGIALMAVNLRKYTANKDQLTKNNGEKWKKENLSWLKFSFFLF